MKKLAIVLTAVFTLVAGAAFAQSTIKKGLKVGVGFANLAGNEVKGSSMRTGFTAGAFVEVPMSDYFSLQPEANFFMAGADGNLTIFSQNTYKKVELSYLQLPVIAKFSMPNSSSGFKPSVYFGPTLSLRLSHKFKAPAGTNNIFEDPTANAVTGGALVGIGAEISNVMIDVRYNYDFTNAFRVSNAKNAIISATIGYAF